ncbi:MAG: hypothetical protein ACREB3_14680, partial [Burkholderiales bacterium]
TKETRFLFEHRGWRTIVAFQTRNPVHRAHEYILKCALEIVDGLLLHPLVGETRGEDVPAEVRLQCYLALMHTAYPARRSVLSVYPAAMRYAGPREALLHAVFRQNYGCAYQILGRDHAGVGNYYGPFDAHRIFDEIPKGALEIQPMKIDWTFWCYACGGMASGRTCPHADDDRLLVSGTKLRKWLSEGAEVPAEFSRPEVLEILREYYAASEKAGTAS